MNDPGYVFNDRGQRLVAIAMIYQQGRFLMQLRDEVPGLAAAGCWAFFGGHLEGQETPPEALKRELYEEISYNLTVEPFYFGEYNSETVVRYIFAVPLQVPFATLELKEGWDLGWGTPEDIDRGEIYSFQAQQIRPIFPTHRQILLDFMKQSPIDWQQ